jgi:hypothetical protein
MSFNFLKFGLNIKKQVPKKPVELEEEVENNISMMFPDCSQLKKNVLLLKKKINLVENEKISEKLKDKKLEDLLEKLKISKEALHEKLSLNSPQIEEIDPLCSFEEIQK